jgi:hypothetical protein
MSAGPKKQRGARKPCGWKHWFFLIFFGCFLVSRQESDKKPEQSQYLIALPKYQKT